MKEQNQAEHIFLLNKTTDNSVVGGLECVECVDGFKRQCIQRRFYIVWNFICKDILSSARAQKLYTYIL